MNQIKADDTTIVGTTTTEGTEPRNALDHSILNFGSKSEKLPTNITGECPHPKVKARGRCVVPVVKKKD